MTEQSIVKDLIQRNLEKLEEEGPVPSYMEVFKTTLDRKEELIKALSSVLPSDHPWFKIAGVEPPIAQSTSSFMDVYRERHHILSPGLRRWRDDISEEEMEAAKDAPLKYDASEETAHTRRAKAEYKRRRFCAFEPTFAQIAPVENHDWKWRARLYG